MTIRIPGGSPGDQDVDIVALLDRAPVGAMLIWTIAICALAAMIDGFDVQAMSFVAPVLVEAWKIPAGSFGVIFSAALLGIMVGQFLFTPLADRWGRKWLIIAGMVLFALLSLATTLARDMQTLLLLRFIGGVGLGGVTPNLIALTAEYSPTRVRATMITIMFGGFSLGAVVGGFLSSVLIPAYGWPSIFLVGGLAPLVMTPILIFGLPESVRFMAVDSAPDAKIGAVLDRVWPGRPRFEGERFVLTEVRMKGLSVRRLFDRDLAPTTALLWMIYLFAMLLTYILLSWLPTVLRAEGLPLAYAQRAGAILSLGGVVGGIAFGFACDRLSPLPVLMAAYALSGLAIFALGLVGADAAGVMLVSFIAGFTTIGAQTALNAAVAGFYPTQVRATGVGYAMGIGRIGSVVGPIVGGVLIGSHWPPATLFAVSAMPTVLAVLLLAGLAAVRRVRHRARGLFASRVVRSSH